MLLQRLPCASSLHRSILCFVFLSSFSPPLHAATAFAHGSSKQDHGLRGLESSSPTVTRVQKPQKKGDSGVDGEEDESDVKKKKNTLEKDATGSPTSTDMKKIDKAIRKTQKIYAWPLASRLCLVGAILSLPLLVIAVSIRSAPMEGDLATNVYVKTAIHCGFSFSIGWINCIMLLRYKVFATMMVGNTILMGVAFVCNGGFSTAEEESWTWWQGSQVKALCPAQFENAGHYALMILLFLVGTFIQGLCYKTMGLSSRFFAPVCAMLVISVEMLEYFGVIHDSKLDVYMLSPVFGIIVSISLHCGVGGVPWSATGNMTSAGFNLAAALVGQKTFPYAEIHKVVVNCALWVSFVTGICMGTFFHSNRTVIFNALYMQGLLYFNGVVFQPIAEQEPLIPATQKERAQVDDGCVFTPGSLSLPRTASAQVFIG